jgi:6-phosphogluconolactonase/glucosamine-6-phosphate isomerase/deaminase
MSSGQIEFKKIISTDEVAEYIANNIKLHLDNNEKVFWLVAGGSSIPITVETSKLLANSRLNNLSVSLTDERYGPIGHKDSNWQQLLEAGLFLKGAELIPVLEGGNLDDTTLSYAGKLASQLKDCDFSVGLFGIGTDGHTAGILPGSRAIEAKTLTVWYDGIDYKRVTATPQAITKLDEAVVYAVGKGKWPVLDKLDRDLSLDIMPAQLLKRVRKLTVFNDIRGH